MEIFVLMKLLVFGTSPWFIQWSVIKWDIKERVWKREFTKNTVYEQLVVFPFKKKKTIIGCLWNYYHFSFNCQTRCFSFLSQKKKKKKMLFLFQCQLKASRTLCTIWWQIFNNEKGLDILLIDNRVKRRLRIKITRVCI